MRNIAALALIAWLFLPGSAVPSTTAPAKSPATHKAVAAKKATAHKATSAKSRRRRSSSSRRRRKASWRTGQMQPTPDRYKEIQQALVAKGYSSQTPDGVWGPDWIDALKRFQQDQKLEPTGKLNSLSLITLGLGPKRESAGAAPQTPPTNAPSNPDSHTTP